MKLSVGLGDDLGECLEPDALRRLEQWARGGDYPDLSRYGLTFRAARQISFSLFHCHISFRGSSVKALTCESHPCTSRVHPYFTERNVASPDSRQLTRLGVLNFLLREIRHRANADGFAWIRSGSARLSSPRSSILVVRLEALYMTPAHVCSSHCPRSNEKDLHNVNRHRQAKSSLPR